MQLQRGGYKASPCTKGVTIPSIRTYITHQEPPPGALDNASIAVIDVLRATTSIATALYNGATKVIPVRSQQDAFREVENNRDWLLAGEEDGRRIPGFDLGNSPVRLLPEVVAGRTIVLSTSNGTRAVKRADTAGGIIAACFNNIDLAVDFLHKKDDIVLLCAGRLAEYAAEDFLLAGAMARQLLDKQEGYAIDNRTELALLLWQHTEDVRDFIMRSEHGKYLTELGFTRDIEYSSKLNTVPVLPILSDGGFIAGGKA